MLMDEDDAVAELLHAPAPDGIDVDLGDMGLDDLFRSPHVSDREDGDPIPPPIPPEPELIPAPPAPPPELEPEPSGIRRIYPWNWFRGRSPGPIPSAPPPPELEPERDAVPLPKPMPKAMPKAKPRPNRGAVPSEIRDLLAGSRAEIAPPPQPAPPPIPPEPATTVDAITRPVETVHRTGLRNPLDPEFWQGPEELKPLFRSGVPRDDLVQRRIHRASKQQHLKPTQRWNTSESDRQHEYMVFPNNRYRRINKSMVTKGSKMTGRPRKADPMTGQLLGRMRMNRDMGPLDPIHPDDVVVYTQRRAPQKGDPPNVPRFTTYGQLNEQVAEPEKQYKYVVLRGQRFTPEWAARYGHRTMRYFESMERTLNETVPTRYAALRLEKANEASRREARERFVREWVPAPPGDVPARLPTPVVPAPAPATVHPSENGTSDRSNVWSLGSYYAREEAEGSEEGRRLLAASAVPPPAPAPVAPTVPDAVVAKPAPTRFIHMERGTGRLEVPLSVDPLAVARGPIITRGRVTPPNPHAPIRMVHRPEEEDAVPIRRIAEMAGLQAESESGSSSNPGGDPSGTIPPQPGEGSGLYEPVGELPRDLLDPRVERQAIYRQLRGAQVIAGNFNRAAIVRPLPPTTQARYHEALEKDPDEIPRRDVTNASDTSHGERRSHVPSRGFHATGNWGVDMAQADVVHALRHDRGNVPQTVANLSRAMDRRRRYEGGASSR